MHRPNLIIRRLGAKTFGLGYFQDGVWIDHLAADDAAAPQSAGRAAADDVTAIDVIHQLFSCCADPVDGEQLRGEAGSEAEMIFQAVAGTAQR
jgi:hypothetical protein